MVQDQATYETYLGVEVTLANGRKIRGQALTITDAIRFTRLRDLAGMGSISALNEILDDFPKAAGLERERFNGAELLAEVLPHFLFRSGSGILPGLEMMTGPAASLSTSGSTT